MTKKMQAAVASSGEALDAPIGETGPPMELEALVRQMKQHIVERMLGTE